MKRLLLALLIAGGGLLGFGTLRQSAGRAAALMVSSSSAWQAATNQLVELNRDAAVLRVQVADKRGRLKEASLHPTISPELRELLAGQTGNSAAWAELREQLGIGWNSSRDYVLVRKSVLKQLNLQPLDREAATRAVLAISPAEQTAIKTAVQSAKETAWTRLQRTDLQRTEPTADIVAQYTIPAADASFEQGISNNFVAQISTILGAERADVFLNQGWNELRNQLALAEPESVTMTIHRSMTNGEPRFTCEIREGNSSRTSDVRYAHYPSLWFLALFPGGWEAIAQREGFDLPKNFRNSGQDR